MGKHGRPTPLALHRRTMKGPRGQKVTQELIAAWAGIPNCQGLVSKVERGHLPEPELAKVLAKAYGLEPEEFTRLVTAAQSWELPLWRYAEERETPAEVVAVLTPTAIDLLARHG